MRAIKAAKQSVESVLQALEALSMGIMRWNEPPTPIGCAPGHSASCCRRRASGYRPPPSSAPGAHCAMLSAFAWQSAPDNATSGPGVYVYGMYVLNQRVYKTYLVKTYTGPPEVTEGRGMMHTTTSPVHGHAIKGRKMGSLSEKRILGSSLHQLARATKSEKYSSS